MRTSKRRRMRIKLNCKHLGIKHIQPKDNTGVGRPRRTERDLLLYWEGVWVELFLNLRDGVPETQVEIRGASGMQIKASHDQAKFIVSSQDETLERGGRATVYTNIPGEKPTEVIQPRIVELPEGMQTWENKVQQLEDKFHRIVMGDETRFVLQRAVEAEFHIWEALKRARSGTQIRRAYSRSKIWLISRVEAKGGGYIDWSWHPYPRALYRHAQKFCDAKLDPRYPARDERRTGDYRRIEYFARVMAGLSLDIPISPSYSVEFLRKLKHQRSCGCWRCVRKIAPRYPRSFVQFLSEFSFKRV